MKVYIVNRGLAPHILNTSTRTVVPNLISIAYPLATYFSKNVPLHISKMFVINIVAVSCLTLLMCVPFSAIIQFFSRTPKCPGSYPRGVRVPQVGNHYTSWT